MGGVAVAVGVGEVKERVASWSRGSGEDEEDCRPRGGSSSAFEDEGSAEKCEEEGSGRFWSNVAARFREAAVVV